MCTRRWSSTDGWHPDRKRLYEFICRSFLASCSKPAVGFQTQIEATIAGETFSTTGVAALEAAACTVQAHVAWRLSSADNFESRPSSWGRWLLHVGSQCLNTRRPNWHSCREHRPHAPEAELDAGHGNTVSGL